MKLIYLFIAVGGFAGGAVPTLFGADINSVWGVIGAAIGSILGILIYRRMDIE